MFGDENEKKKVTCHERGHSAVTRIRTWVVSATTRSTNHYTITAIASPDTSMKFWRASSQFAVTATSKCIRDIFNRSEEIRVLKMNVINMFSVLAIL